MPHPSVDADTRRGGSRYDVPSVSVAHLAVVHSTLMPDASTEAITFAGIGPYGYPKRDRHDPEMGRDGGLSAHYPRIGLVPEDPASLTCTTTGHER
jgi:hypothetical protein